MPPIRPVHWKVFEGFLVSVGCKFVREKGDHRIYWRKDMKRPIVVPRYNPLPVAIVLNNLRTLGVSREEFIAYLDGK